ncbi:MAG: MFS transporter [Tagaea sp. CACIAM 22H2]|nr:MFS transporter [Tagaea sp. CACIAM 22H2]
MSNTDSEAAPGLSRTAAFALAAAAGLAVANIYYNQPMLEVIERDLPGAATAAIPTATQLGYAAGLLLLVPLGDIVERRGLIVAHFVALAAALVFAAMAPGGFALAAASLAIGALAAVAQQVVPFAAHLAGPAKRGAAVGFVLSGLLAGILLSRTLAGFVATHAGWREMFWLAVPLALAAALALRFLLPRSVPEAPLPYFAALRSMVTLWIEFAPLRRAAATQAALFACFTLFWTVLPFRLATPEFGLGADIAGLFGLIGMIGVLAAPIVGRFVDKRGSAATVVIGALMTLASWLVFGGWTAIPGMVIGVVLLDLGLQSALIANQHIVFALRPAARSRINTVLMSSMFIGGAAGSALGVAAWNAGGWFHVSALGIGFGAVAVAIQILAFRRRVA